MILDRRRSIADQIYDELRRMVIQLELKPGQPLSEKLVAERFRVSRTPVREAVLRLADHGLLTIAPQFGTFIAAIDPDEVRQAQFMRAHLEVAIALRLCDRRGLDLSPARSLIAQQQSILSTSDFANFTVLDDRMHAWLFDAAGMGKLWASIHVKKAHLDRIRFLHVPEPGKIAEVAAQHTGILDAIEAGDRPATEQRVREHTAGSVVYMEKLLVDRPDLFAITRLSRPRQAAG
jgi:GntR family transcriptional regulator, rspAB operon transcriptional repressor